MLVEPVSYGSRKREYLGNFFPCLESFRHAQSGRIAKRKERSNEEEPDDATGFACSGESHQGFRSRMIEGKKQKEGHKSKKESKKDAMGKDEMQARRQRETERQYAERPNAALVLNGVLAYLTATQSKTKPEFQNLRPQKSKEKSIVKATHRQDR